MKIWQARHFKHFILRYESVQERHMFLTCRTLYGPRSPEIEGQKLNCKGL